MSRSTWAMSPRRSTSGERSSRGCGCAASRRRWPSSTSATRSWPCFQHEVEPRSEHRHFGLVVDDVAAVVAAARERGAGVRGNNVSDPWGNWFDVVAYGEVQFTKVEPVLRAQNAVHLTKSESALAELREKGIELSWSPARGGGFGRTSRRHPECEWSPMDRAVAMRPRLCRPDQRGDIDGFVSGHKAVARIRATGTHQGEFLAVPATGKSVDVQLIDITRFGDDGLAHEHWGCLRRTGDDAAARRDLAKFPRIDSSPRHPSRTWQYRLRMGVSLKRHSRTLGRTLGQVTARSAVTN